MTTTTTPVTARVCRACGDYLETILHLGHLHPSAFPALGEAPHPAAPLDFCRCKRCRLVQLRHTVDPDLMFKDQYWYRSSINEVMRAELADIVAGAIARVPAFTTKDLVVDIGANDGTLLAAYRTHPPVHGVTRIAFEPARNLQAALAPHAEVRIPDYFPQGLGQLHLQGRCKVISSIACVYDLDDPGAFAAAIADCLTPDGVWVVQFQDLAAMVNACAFDNICFEHLCYYSLHSFEQVIAPFGLEVVDAEIRAINGGSYRLWVQQAGGPLTTRAGGLSRLLTVRRKEAGCDDWDTLERFAWRVGEARRQIQAAVEAELTAGGVVDAYGASTKFNTLLQYCGLGPDVIRQAIERSPEKWGRATATGIPIVSEDAGRADPASAWLVGIWQFRAAILQREAGYLGQGGRLIFPLPVVDVITQQRAVSA
jgi:NDP-4-keto-2,6-dideoxyhexose 3-C-methyltransferase